MITILIKTFKRPAVLKRLLDSIREHQPNIPVIVQEDEEDMGVAKGRNLLVAKCKTPYCMILDDDCIFTENTNLEKAIQILEERNLDILELDAGEHFKGLFSTEGETVRFIDSNRGGLYDFVTNIFVAKTDVLSNYPWDERFKTGEHFAFFYKYRGKLKIGTTKDVSLLHEHINVPGYDKYRQRAVGYVQTFMRENGIKRRIDLSNITIEA